MNPLCSALLKAGVSADVRYSDHPTAAAETADSGTSSIQHCDCQPRISQACCEGAASSSDGQPVFQPCWNSSKDALTNPMGEAQAKKEIYSFNSVGQ